LRDSQQVDEYALAVTLEAQRGLVTRRQVLACGGADAFIERKLRRREWARIHPGVFIEHTGPLRWAERAWAAILYYWPAALSHESALQSYGLRISAKPSSSATEAGSPFVATDADPFRQPLHIAVDKQRRVGRLPNVRLHRMTGLADRTTPASRPPRMKLEHALLDVASRTTGNADAVAVLGDACQCRRTTPQRLLGTLEGRPTLRRRGFLVAVLTDVATGAYSVLEHRYLTRVERPHGLPTGVISGACRPAKPAPTVTSTTYSSKW
jgi:hypothetical protein